MISWLFAKFYDKLMLDAEERCLRDWRQSLLKNLGSLFFAGVRVLILIMQIPHSHSDLNKYAGINASD